jgi:hypothetical protein
MKKPTMTGEFSKYGAKPINPRWACSAVAVLRPCLTDRLNGESLFDGLVFHHFAISGKIQRMTQFVTRERNAIKYTG